MDLDKEFVNLCTKRIIRAKMNILGKNGFYGLLLSNIIFALDEKCETACTDGKRIWFGTEFIKELNDAELEFIMMHELMHIVLQHCLRGVNYENDLYNISADIVVNSNILHSFGNNLSVITLERYGESMHLCPNGEEGYNYTAEEVYNMLLANKEGKQIPNSKAKSKKGKKNNPYNEQSTTLIDDHSKWQNLTEDEKREIYEIWTKRIRDTATTISILESSISDGSGMPLGAKRLIEGLKGGQLDWRTILTNFLQSQVCDYSFSPPDRRFSESDFFLPDFNEKDEMCANVWFLVDTSGSISDKQIMHAYSEIASIIEQFNGKIQGLLSFTEVFVTDPVPFSSLDDLLKIKPVGGGGNDFEEIFKYMQRNMRDNLPAYIVIITDGQAHFPDEKEALGVPVLWLINNESITPPWGKVARISTE